MRLLDLRCPACGGIISEKITSRTLTCEYCGSRFALDDDEAATFMEDAADSCEDGAASSLSMADFAAEACAQFIDIIDESDFRSSPKILRGLEVPSGEDVFLIHDDTLMKSGKNGFAITERGLYCRELAEKVVFYDWSSFARMKEPRVSDSYVKCGGSSVCYFTDDDDVLPDLMDLYAKLQAHARAAC